MEAPCLHRLGAWVKVGAIDRWFMMVPATWNILRTPFSAFGFLEIFSEIRFLAPEDQLSVFSRRVNVIYFFASQPMSFLFFWLTHFGMDQTWTPKTGGQIWNGSNSHTRSIFEHDMTNHLKRLMVAYYHWNIALHDFNNSNDKHNLRTQDLTHEISI